MRPPPRRLSGQEHLRYANDRQEWIRKEGAHVGGQTADPIHEHGVKTKTSLFDLPYWKVRVSPESRFMTVTSDIGMCGI
jgi:hypothetical protein